VRHPEDTLQLTLLKPVLSKSRFFIESLFVVNLVHSHTIYFSDHLVDVSLGRQLELLHLRLNCAKPL
jgi:hypothetical protein